MGNRVMVSQKQIKWIVFLVSFAVCLFLSFRAFRFNPYGDFKYYLLTGDEPHYLLITQSLIFDKDFNLWNNVRNNDWRFFEHRPVDGHAPGFTYYNNLAKGRLESKEKLWQDRRYSVHRIGLPLLISPAYFLGIRWKLGVRWAVILFLNLCIALLAVNIYALSFELTNNKIVSLWVWAVLSFSGPALFYSNKIFPDLLAALFIIFAYRKIRNLRRIDFVNPFIIGLCIAYLPWLHERFILTSFILFLFFVYSVKLSVKPIIISLIPIAISFILQGAYYNLLFGVPFPVNVHPSFSLRNCGLLGLLFDRNLGLLFYSPVYIISLIGALGLLKERPKEFFWLSLIFIPNYIILGLFREWWGGLCPPVRYLLPFVPLLTLPISYALLKIRNISFKIMAVILGLAGIIIANYAMWFPGMLYRYSHPLSCHFNRIINIFPNFIERSPLTYQSAVIWIILVVFFTGYYGYAGFYKKMKNR